MILPQCNIVIDANEAADHCLHYQLVALRLLRVGSSKAFQVTNDAADIAAIVDAPAGKMVASWLRQKR